MISESGTKSRTVGEMKKRVIGKMHPFIVLALIEGNNHCVKLMSCVPIYQEGNCFYGIL